MHSKAGTDESTNAEFRDCQVRDALTGPETCEISEIRFIRLLQGDRGTAVATFFDGPEKCICEREKSASLETDLTRARSQPSNLNPSDITSTVILHCQGIIERQMELVMRAMGIKIDRNDRVQLIGQLSIVEEIQRETELMKKKLLIKVDQSFFTSQLKLYLTREEFFVKCAEAGIHISQTPISQPVERFGKVVTPARQIHSRKTKERRGAPLPLVPARSPMMSVNEKFLKGKDNRLYLREMTGIADRSYREPNPVGTRSYYERSRTSMEVDGVDAILDFQPFVPADDPRVQTAKVRVETYDIDPAPG
jgi:hypothetical protein